MNMAIQVKVPSLGESITSGVIAAWHVKDGDTVSNGQHLYDLETDKITSEGLAEADGVIQLKAQEGDEVEIGAVIAEIEPGTGSQKQSSDEGSGDRDDDKEDTEAAGPQPEASGEERRKDDGASKGSEGKKEAATRKSAAKAVSPAVRRIADETGIDPATVDGTGKGGRVTKADMLKAQKGRDESGESGGTESVDRQEKAGKDDGDAAESAEREEATAEKEAGSAKSESPGADRKKSVPDAQTEQRVTRRKMSPLRKRVAEHLVSAQRTAAILTTFNEVDMTAVIALRKRHQESFQERHGIKLGFMSFFVKATVHALQQVPALNARVEGDEIVEHHFYDIGVAVSSPRGLLVPVVRNCDRISFAEIEQELTNFGQKAKEGKIGIDDLQGGVFTISNGGIFGSLLSTPILNQPQSGILGMHTIKERPVVVDGAVVARPMMYLAVSYDHRIVDGREAVTFLVKIKEAIEDPARLMLGL